MKKLIIIFLFLFIFSACANNPVVKEEMPKELNIYNWEDYFGETTITDFEKEFDIKVNLFTFADEDFMESDVQSNPEKYDLIIASDSLINEMNELKLLAEINKKNISNIKNIGDKFIDPWYDSENKFSVPYFWGTTGLLINTKYVPKETDTWSILWEEKYKGRIGLLNNAEEVISLASKYLGYSLLPNTVEEFANTKEELFKLKNIVGKYSDVIEIKEKMISEDLWLAQIYSGEGLNAVNQNENLVYIIPKEGAAMWIDNFAIPREAKNKLAAEMFINFVLRPKVSADIANYLWYANTNEAARPYTNEEILNDKSLYPLQNVLDKLELFKPSNMNYEINKLWAELNKK